MLQVERYGPPGRTSRNNRQPATNKAPSPTPRLHEPPPTPATTPPRGPGARNTGRSQLHRTGNGATRPAPAAAPAPCGKSRPAFSSGPVAMAVVANAPTTSSALCKGCTETCLI